MSRIEELLRRFVDERRLPSATWSIGLGALQERGAVGMHEGAVVTLDTPFDLASLTKPLATLPLVSWLIGRGELDGATPVADVLQELRTSAWSATTIDQLTSHTSGLPDWMPLYVEGRGVDAYLESIAKMPRTGRVGDVRYSDLGFMLLGFVVERRAGLPLGEAFERFVKTALGIRGRIGFAGSRDRFEDAAPVERGNAFEQRMIAERRIAAAPVIRAEIPKGEVHDGNAWGLGGVAGHAGLFGTVEAVVELAGALARPGVLGLPERIQRRWFEEQAPGRTAGWELAAANRATRGLLPPRWIGHLGFTGTSLWLTPERTAFDAPGKALSPDHVALLTNRVHPEVDGRDFQILRRAFHRLAWRGSVT